MKLFSVFSIFLIILSFVIAEDQTKEQETASSVKVETNVQTAADKTPKEPVKEADDDSNRQKKSFSLLQSGKPIYGDPIPLKVTGGSEYPSVPKSLNYAEHLPVPLKQTLNYDEAVPLNLGYGGHQLNYGEHVLDYGTPLVDYGSYHQQHYNNYGVHQPQQLHYGVESLPLLHGYGDSILSSPHLPSYKAAPVPVPAPAPVQYKPPQVPAEYRPPQIPAAYKPQPVPAGYKPPLIGPIYKPPTHQVQPQKQPQVYQMQQPAFRQPFLDYYQSMNVYDTAQSVYAPPSVVPSPAYRNAPSNSCKSIAVGCAPTVQLASCQGGYGGYGSGYKVGGYGYGGSY